MFQFLRRVSGSLLPRPDRPWRDDATSHAPTIGRKRRYSVTEQDDDDSTSSIVKKAKNDPISPDIESDSASGAESPKVLSTEGQEVKEVTKGVKEVDLDDEDKVQDASSIRPESVPLPDSPPRLPERESASPELVKSDAVEETKGREYADDGDSVASSAPQDDAEQAEEESLSANTDDSADGAAPAQEAIIAIVESSLHDIPETPEARA